MWISFSRPLYLLLLPLAAALLWHSARVSFADLTGARRWIAWTLRSLIVLALLFALAGAQLVKRSDQMVVVFAADTSYSVSPDDRAKALDFIRDSLTRRRSRDRGALVLFGRHAVVESENLRTPSDVTTVSRPSPTHTDIAAALRLALGLIPPDAAGKLVLLSDGNENVGAAAQEALLAGANRVPIDVFPLTTRAAKDVLVREVSIPSEARREEPFPVRITVEATEPAQASLSILVNDQPIHKQPVTLPAGTTALRIPLSISDAGFSKVDVLLEAPDEQSRENNRAAAFVRIKGEPRVLIVDSDPADAAALSRTLKAQDILVAVGGPAALPTNTADLERYDAVFLSNYPAYRMDPHQMVMLRDATRDLGVGLGMIGGEYSFGAGGYYQTPIEEALPVDMDVRKHRVFPASSVLLVMDTSGSMSMIEDGKEKIQLAAEAACAIVDLLQPYDSIGFIASDPTPTLVCKLRHVQNRAAIKRDIRSVRAGGGGIACYPSLSAAYDVLRDNDSAVRHIILLADGSDCDQQPGSVPLVQRMASENITLTAVAFGDGPHVPFLKNVAASGSGQFYLTERARDLKKIFTRETLTVARSVLVEEQFQPRLADSTPVIHGLDWSSAPPLLGYVATSPKSLSRVPLISHKEDPIFAHWQYGLGKSIAFTSDAKAHWAAHWLGWRGFPQFWGQAVRWTLRQLSTEVLYPRVELSGDKAHIVVDAVADDGSLLNGLEMRATVSTPTGGRAQVVLGQTAPGRYEATVESPDRGAYVVGLTASGPGDFDARQTVGFSVSYPPDFADTHPSESFLNYIADQTGGKILADPEGVFQRPAVMPRVPVNIWRTLLWIAALLLPLDVAVRRLVIRREDLALFTQPLRSAARRLRVTRVVTRPATMERLLTRKQAARRPAAPQPPIEPIEIAPSEPEARPAPSPEAPEPSAEQPSPPREPEESTTSRLLRRKRQLRQPRP